MTACMYIFNYVGGDSIVYVIVGAIVGVIVVVLLLVVVFCCIARSKST